MNTNSGRILVIDDEEEVRKSFLLALEKIRCTVDVAESGETGIARFRAQPYDLVFLDLKMPGLDGVATLRAIRAVSSSVPVYVVTAFHQAFLEGLHAAEGDGIVFELLQKPLESCQIRLLVETILAGTGGTAGGRPAASGKAVAAGGAGSQRSAEGQGRYRLKLYIAGQTTRSMDAVKNLSALLDAALPGRYLLTTVDVLKNSELAREYDVFATPTLVKCEPPPVRKVVGDFRDQAKVLSGLGIRP